MVKSVGFGFKAELGLSSISSTSLAYMGKMGTIISTPEGSFTFKSNNIHDAPTSVSLVSSTAFRNYYRPSFLFYI